MVVVFTLIGGSRPSNILVHWVEQFRLHPFFVVVNELPHVTHILVSRFDINFLNNLQY